jgi:GWxTD domain-containing protein
METIAFNTLMTGFIRRLISDGGMWRTLRKTAFFCLVLGLPAGMQPADKVFAEDRKSELTLYAGVVYYPNPEYDSVALVEFPFTLNRSELEFFKPDSADDNYYGRIFTEVVLIDSNGYAVDSAKSYFSVQVRDLQEAGLRDYKLFDNLTLWVVPGSYTARLTVIDAVSKRETTVFYDSVLVPPIDKDQLALGGVTLAYSVSYVGDSGAGNRKLVRNGLKVYPNPLGIFSSEDTAICLYAELYNLDYDPGRASSFRVDYTIQTEFGGLFRDFGYKVLEKPGSSAVIAESFDIADCFPGDYYLWIVAEDLVSKQTTDLRVPFKVVSPDQFLSFELTAGGAIDPYDTLDLKTKLNLVAYLLTPEQKAVLDGLSDQGKLNYLDRYWRENDVDPGTEAIENRRDMIRRYEFVNFHYSTDERKLDGWASDRGRIYMTYGEWDKKEESPAPLTGNPYEVWWYFSIQEGIVFVFEDKYGYEDHTLVHSNMEGQVFSDDWNRLLKQGFIEPY